MNIAFIGPGRMGGPLAANPVRAGHSLSAKDLRRVETAGARRSDDPARGPRAAR
jgi:3-hydroxyisobutyrate dehydrogenase-like beta-hydroxyacid dehydrogenase